MQEILILYDTEPRLRIKTILTQYPKNCAGKRRLMGDKVLRVVGEDLQNASSRDFQLYLTEDGSVSVRRRKKFGFTLPETLKVGETLTLMPFPADARIFIDEELIGTVDASRSLDLDFDSPGHWRLRFEHDDYVPFGGSLEIVA